MKHVVLALACGLGLASSVETALGSWRALERGPHHTLWQHAGDTSSAPARFIELATGLNYRSGGEWRPSQPGIRIEHGKAVVRQGALAMEFSRNASSVGAIQVSSDLGFRLRSHLVGLAYHDTVADLTVWLALPVANVGAVLPPNRVLYTRALEGACHADVRYTARREGLEQDVLLRQAPPSPGYWNLDPATTDFEVWTEFVDSPAPVLWRSMDAASGPQPARMKGLRRDEDVLVDFGQALIGPGEVYPLDQADAFDPASALTRKRWVTMGDRQFLVERIPYPEMTTALSRLPLAAATRSAVAGGLVSSVVGLPALPRGEPGGWSDRQAALQSADQPGLVLDYRLTVASLTNFTFTAGTTYLIRDKLTLFGATTIEGNAVIKFAGGGGAQLEFMGSARTQSSMHRPVYLTAVDDDRHGLTLPESAGAPNGVYAAYTLVFRGTAEDYHLENLRILYTGTGLALYPDARVRVCHSRWRHGWRAAATLSQASLALDNVLLVDQDYLHWGLSEDVSLRHATVDRVRSLSRFASRSLAMTNCLLGEVSNPWGVAGSHNYWVGSDAFNADEMAGLTYHLPESSPYVDAGTLEIPAELIAALKQRTTFAPIRLDGLRDISSVLHPVNPRDMRAPDAGYHYDPVDFLIDGLIQRQGDLTATGGVAIGFLSRPDSSALRLDGDVWFKSHGTVENPNRFVDYTTIGELPVTHAAAQPFLTTSGHPDPGPALDFEFTEILLSPAVPTLSSADASTRLQAWHMRNCRLECGPSVVSLAPGTPGLNWINNLWQDASIEILQPATSRGAIHNNLFLGGALTWELESTADSQVTDSLFLGTELRSSPSSSLSHHHNGYLEGAPRWPGSQGADVVLNVAPSWVEGPFGHHYYSPEDPTAQALRDAGSRPAAEFGLFHHTTDILQTRESDTIVDIGFHYPAANAAEAAWDSDLDGLADHVEDADGNGRVNGLELDFLRADTDGDGVWDPQEVWQGRSPLVPGAIEPSPGEWSFVVFTPFL